MRIRNRSMIIMLSQGLNRGTQIVLGIVLVRLVDQQVFGTYRQALLVYSLVGGVIALDLGQSLYYFVTKLQRQLHGVLLCQTYLVAMVLSALMAVTLWIGATPIASMFGNPALAPLLRILAFYPFAERLLTIIPAFMISLDRAVRAGCYSIATTGGRIIAVITAITTGHSLAVVMWALIAVAVVVSVIGTVDMLRLSRPVKLGIDRALVSEQIQYTWPLWTTALVMIVNLQYGKMVISCFFNPATYAVYSCGATELPVAALFTTTIATAIMPNLVSLGVAGRMDRVLAVWHEATRKSSLVIFPCFAFFCIVSHDFIVLLYGSDYARAAWPFSILLIRLPIRIAAYGALLRAVGKTRPIAVSAVIALGTNIVVATSLTYGGRGSLLSFVGPAIGDVTSSILSVLYMLAVIRREFSISWAQVMRWRDLGATMALCGVAAGLTYTLPLSAFPVAARLVTQFVFFSLVFVGLMILGRRFQKDELELAAFPLRKALQIFHR